MVVSKTKSIFAVVKLCIPKKWTSVIGRIKIGSI